MYFLKRNNKSLRAVALITVLSIIFFTFVGCVEESVPETNTSNPSTILSFYSELQANEAYPYTLTEKAKDTLEKKESLFIDNSIEGCEENTDVNLEYRALDKNIDNYGDKLIYLSEALVLQIEETDLDDGTKATEMLICDADENCYQIISLCGYDNIYKEDIISVYGLPIAKSSFSNVSGGTTLVIILAASHIEKIPE